VNQPPNPPSPAGIGQAGERRSAAETASSAGVAREFGAAQESGLVSDPGRRRNILIAMILALVAVVGSVSGLNVAQQQLAIELGASQSELLWIINGYTLALAALLMPVGAIGDRWGRKPILIAGLALFAISNGGAMLATSTTGLLIARIAAGAAAAMIMPVTLSVITSSFPVEERAKAVGTWSGFAGAGGILGLFVSSFLIDRVAWPWLFAMPIGFALIALLMTVRFVGNSKEDHAGRFDVVGSVLSALAIGGLVLGIHEGPEKGWTDPLTLAGLIVGGLAMIGFVIWELRVSHPILDLRVFRNRGLATGSVTLLIVFAVLMGIFLVLIQFLQAVAGYSALRAATGLLPMAAVMMPLSTAAPSIAKRIGLRTTLLIGAALFGGGLALLAMMVSVEGGYWSILPGLLVLGVGIGLLMSPSTTAITESLPEEHQGVASALNDTVREFGGAVGIALLGSVLNAGYRSSVSASTGDLPPELAHQVEEGIGSAYASAGELGTQAPAVIGAAKQALVDGWQLSMWVGVVMAAAVFAFIALRAPRGRAPETVDVVTDGEIDGDSAILVVAGD
jgi:EmrB/QacA subfamily drug resistance transporter